MTAYTIIGILLYGGWIYSVLNLVLALTRGRKALAMMLHMHDCIFEYRIRHSGEFNTNPYEWPDYKRLSILKVCWSFKPITFEAWFPPVFLDKLKS